MFDVVQKFSNGIVLVTSRPLLSFLRCNVQNVACINLVLVPLA